MSHPSSGQPWNPGEPEQNQPPYGNYSPGPNPDPAGSGPFGPAQPQSGGPAYPQPYGGDPAYGGQPQSGGGYPPESYTTDPPYSGQPYSAQPHSGQPYSAQPYSGQPYDQGQGYQPGYGAGTQQPGYQQSGFPPAQGYQPGHPGPQSPPPRRGRGGLIALLASLGVLVLLVCGIGVVALVRASDDDDVNTDPTRGAQPSATVSPTPTAKPDYPATIVLSDTVAGMTRLTDPALTKTADEIAVNIKEATNADSASAGFYAASADSTRIVALIGATARVSSPSSELDDAFESSELNVSNLRTVDAGPMGGVMRCGNSSTNGTAMTVCGWADGGSLALGMFLNRSFDDSAELFRKIRGEILRRG